MSATEPGAAAADADDPGEALARLVSRLDIESSEDPHTFHGEAGATGVNAGGRLFGGLVVAQSVVAAGRAMRPSTIHSIQQVFLRGGRVDLGLRYRVEPMFEGRTYSSARVEVWQDGDIISHATVGLSKPVGGPDRQAPPPAGPPLARCVDRGELRGLVRPGGQPITFRVDPDQHGDLTPEYDAWMRAAGDVPDDQLMHRALLAFSTDRAMMSTAWKPHADLGPHRGATLNHSVWFHRDLDFAEWHVHAMRSPNFNDARAMIFGEIYSADGERVASTAQEGTMRVKRQVSEPAAS